MLRAGKPLFDNSLCHALARTVQIALAVALASCSSGQGSGPPTTVPPEGLTATGTQYPRSRITRRVSSTPTTDWDSFGFDLGRTGYNPVESIVGVNNVGSLQEIWHFKVGYNMVHEPVYAYGVYVGGQSTNILYAGSNVGATMYAINALTGAVIWKQKVAQRTFTCTGRSPTLFSIGETPAIDRGKNLIYFSDGHNDVYAADLATGALATGWPLHIAPWQQNIMHGGFTYNPSNGLLYAVTGSHCDESPWYGRIVAINTNAPKIVHRFFTMSGDNEQGLSGGGIWGPGGASIDTTSNDVFIATGNGDPQLDVPQNAPYAEQVIELSPTLTTILANNYPTNIPKGPKWFDFDFGATPMLFQPPGCPALLAALNKSGVFELYDRASISSGPIQYIAMSAPSSTGSFVGLPAYDPVTNYVFVGLPDYEGIYQPGMAAFSIASNCTLNTIPAWSANFGPAGSESMVSKRSPISIANGVVYVSNFTGDTEYAFNAASGAQLWEAALPSNGVIGTVIANGMVYVSSFDGTISAWAPPPSARELRKKAAKRPTIIRPDNVSIPDRLGGTIDLRGSLSLFEPPDER